MRHKIQIKGNENISNLEILPQILSSTCQTSKLCCRNILNGICFEQKSFPRYLASLLFVLNKIKFHLGAVLATCSSMRSAMLIYMKNCIFRLLRFMSWFLLEYCFMFICFLLNQKKYENKKIMGLDKAYKEIFRK